FYPDMKRIHGLLPKDRCTYLFSATMPVNVKRLAQEFMRAPKFLSLCSTDISVSNMEHEYYVVDPVDKEKTLLRLIEQENPESAIIFCNTRRDTNYVHEYLRARGLKVGLISGEVNQKQRQKVMKDLKNNEIRFLVATDVAARGIDIQGLTHVFMYDHPDDPEVYVHRAGRTARAGASGQAISIVGLVEEIALKNTASKFDIPFVRKTLKGEKEFGDIIRERTTVYLEQEFRALRQNELGGANRMVPLLESLISSDDEKQVLGMLLHKFYWTRFTGLTEPLPKDEGEDQGDASPRGGGLPLPGAADSTAPGLFTPGLLQLFPDYAAIGVRLQGLFIMPDGIGVIALGKLEIPHARRLGAILLAGSQQERSRQAGRRSPGR